MNLQDIAQEMLKEADKYAVLKETEIPKLVPVRTHKKKRIKKKWLKRYGTKVVYEKKMAKVIDVTMDLVVEFCHEKGLPLPDELLGR